MSKGGDNTALLFLLGCCSVMMCSSAAAGWGWYSNAFCDSLNVGYSCAPAPSPDSSSTPAATPSPTPRTPTPTPGPSASDPRASVWSSGQPLQSDPLEIGSITNSIPLTRQPTLPAVATYTISMDLNVASTFSDWRCILTSSDGIDWNGPSNRPVTNTRRPLILISSGNQIIVNHTDSNSNWQALGGSLYGTVDPASYFTPGQWFNLTITLDSGSKTCNLYINGTLRANSTVPNAFAWPSPATTWVWNNTSYTKSGSIRVANAYFWSSVLAASQISGLVIPSSATPGVATTSYYAVEPYSKD